MFGLIVKIWFMIVLLPIMIFQDANSKLADYLKKKNIYQHWDAYHSILVVLIVVLVLLMVKGYR